MSLFHYLGGQLSRLCGVTGVDAEAPRGLLGDLLGPVGSSPLTEPPPWQSNVADDHTPVEFSIACNIGEPPTLRVLGEALGAPPGSAANLSAGHRFLATQVNRFGLSMLRFDLVRDLFAPSQPATDFTIWHSLVFRGSRRPEFKVYFNPELTGIDRAPALVNEALRRLGLEQSYQTMLDHAVRPGELGGKDRLTFFAVDLHDGPHSRVKLYLTHHDAEVRDVARAASAVDGIDVADVAQFCMAAGGGRDFFDGLPLVGSYTFTSAAGRPVGYSVYVPIRGYVSDDEEARDRVRPLLARYGFDSAVLDRAIAAVTGRSLRDGVGLIAHVSLRLGPPRPGVTVYLSAEAYRVLPPRSRQLAVATGKSTAPTGRAAA